MSNIIVTDIKSRLPMPEGLSGVDAGKWRVLCESVFPMAKTPEAIVLALDYCRARNLDVMKKMVHIVPMWSSSLNREVETVWPGIAEVQTTAARTGKFAGMDEPKWGEEKEREFKDGMKTIKVKFPEWCAVTVYRIVDGMRCAFTEPVYWEEAYGRIGKTELPNAQWHKRPRGMIIKVAKAFSIRAAFPEEGEHVAEEMEGRILEESGVGGVMVDATPLKVGSPFKTAKARNDFVIACTKRYENAKTSEELNNMVNDDKPTFDKMRASTHEPDELAVDEIQKQYRIFLGRLKLNEENISDVPSEEENLSPEEMERLRASEDMSQMEAALGIPAYLNRK